MNKEYIRQACAEAYAGKKPLLIKGYRTSSGEVADYLVKGGGPGAYEAFLKECLAGQASYVFAPQVAAVPYALEDWQAALQAQLLSWRNSLEVMTSGTGATPKRQYINPPIWVEAGYYVHEPDTGVTVLKNLTLLNKTTRSPATGTKTDPAKSANPVTRAKAALLELSPMRHYLGQLNLSPNNIEDISVVHD